MNLLDFLLNILLDILSYIFGKAAEERFGKDIKSLEKKVDELQKAHPNYTEDQVKEVKAEAAILKKLLIESELRNMKYKEELRKLKKSKRPPPPKDDDYPEDELDDLDLEESVDENQIDDDNLDKSDSDEEDDQKEQK